MSAPGVTNDRAGRFLGDQSEADAILRFNPAARAPNPSQLAFLKSIGWKPGGGTSIAEQASAVKYGYVGVNLTGTAADAILALAAKVSDTDLEEDGRESEPHVTVRYGFHDIDPASVRDLLADEPPISMRLGDVSVFAGADTGKDFDVIKVDVVSPDLHRLHAKLGVFPHTDTHPTYKPHATIAYVTVGKGAAYAAEFGALNLNATATEVQVSTAARKKTRVKLAEQTTAQPSSEQFTLREAGFTGEVTASNGVVYHYVDGVRVKSHEHDEHVAKVGKAATVIPDPDPKQFSNLIHLVGEHYAKGDATWKTAGKAIDKLLKKYGGDQAKWEALAKEFGFDPEGKKSQSALLNHLKDHLTSGGFSQAAADDAKGGGIADAASVAAEPPVDLADPSVNADEPPASTQPLAAPLPSKDQLAQELEALKNGHADGTLKTDEAKSQAKLILEDLKAGGHGDGAMVAAGFGDPFGGVTEADIDEYFDHKDAQKAKHTPAGDQNAEPPVTPPADIEPDPHDPAQQKAPTPALPVTHPNTSSPHIAGVHALVKQFAGQPGFGDDQDGVIALTDKLIDYLDAQGVYGTPDIAATLKGAVVAAGGTPPQHGKLHDLGKQLAQLAPSMVAPTAPAAAPSKSSHEKFAHYLELFKKAGQKATAQDLVDAISVYNLGTAEWAKVTVQYGLPAAATAEQLADAVNAAHGHATTAPATTPHPLAHHAETLQKLADIFKSLKNKADIAAALKQQGLGYGNVDQAWIAAGMPGKAPTPWVVENATGITAASLKKHVATLEAKAKEFSGGTVTPAPVAAPAPKAVKAQAAVPFAGGSGPSDEYEQFLNAAKAEAAKPPAASSVDYAGKAGKDIDPSWTPHQSHPAYGGIVLKDGADGKPQVLLRKVANSFGGYVWTFPKGKQEAGHDAATTATKEVLEETGHAAQIVGHLPGTFKSGSDSTTNYFLMKHDGSAPVPHDSETEKVEWVPLEKAHEYIGQTTNPGGKTRDLTTLEAVQRHVSKHGTGGAATGDEPEPQLGDMPLGDPAGYQSPGVETTNPKVDALHAAKSVADVPGWGGMASLSPDKQKVGAAFLRTDPATGQTQIYIASGMGDGLAAVSLGSKSPSAAALAAQYGHGDIIGHLDKPLASGGTTQYGVFYAKPVAGQSLSGGTWVNLDDAASHVSTYASPSQQERLKAIIAGAKKYATGGADPKIAEAATNIKQTVEALTAKKALAAEVAATIKQRLSGLHPSAIEGVAAKLGAPSGNALTQWAAEQVHAGKATVGLPHPSALTGVKSIGKGSTGAKVGTAADGKKFVVKDGAGVKHGQEQLHNETHANKVFGILGASTPKTKLTTDASGKATKVSAWVDGKDLGEWLGGATDAQKAELKTKLQKDFVAHALLGNWDMFGASEDNIKVDAQGNPHYIDNGGVFDVSANGTKKGGSEKPFAPDSVPELDSMRDSSKSPFGAKWFGDIPKSEIKKQIAKAVANKDKIVKAMAGSPHAATVAARIDYLHDWALKDGKPNAVAIHAHDGSKVYVEPKFSKYNLNKSFHAGQEIVKGSSGGNADLLQYLNHVDQSDVDAIKSYTGNAYKGLNEALYAKGAKLSTWQQKLDDKLQSAFSKAPSLSKPITLYRGIGVTGSNLPEFIDFLKRKENNGGAIQWRSYSSCSTDPKKAWSGVKCVIENVTHSAIDVDPLSTVHGEQETLMNRGVKLRVKSVSQSASGQYTVTFEQLPHDYQGPFSEQRQP